MGTCICNNSQVTQMLLTKRPHFEQPVYYVAYGSKQLLWMPEVIFTFIKKQIPGDDFSLRIPPNMVHSAILLGFKKDSAILLYWKINCFLYFSYEKEVFNIYLRMQTVSDSGDVGIFLSQDIGSYSFLPLFCFRVTEVFFFSTEIKT